MNLESIGLENAVQAKVRVPRLIVPAVKRNGAFFGGFDFLAKQAKYTVLGEKPGLKGIRVLFT